MGGTKVGQGTLILSSSNFNHNETTVGDETDETDSDAIADLTIDAEQAEQIQGGPFNNSNSYTGTTTVNQGTLTVR